MSNVLYIAEKPSVAKHLAKHLSLKSADGYYNSGNVYVCWCLGHLLEMDPPDAYDEKLKSWDLTLLPIIPDRFRLSVTTRGKKQFKIISDLIKRANEIIIATDPDREGEVIGRELVERCGYRGPVRRLWLTAVDDKALGQALKSPKPGEETYNLYLAGLGRQRADWLVGMNLTRAFTHVGRQQGYNGVLSVGRVQTPTLALVVKRDREIEAFQPHDYFVIDIVCAVNQGSFSAHWKPNSTQMPVDDSGRCTNERAAATVAQKVLNQPFKVIEATYEQKRESPPLPYDLTSLITDASKRLRLDESRVQEIAQSLYENHKATTYPRTESGYLPETMWEERTDILNALVQSDPEFAPWVRGADTALKRKIWDDSKVIPHHGIVPTASPCDLSAMKDDERGVYDLIRRRFLAQFLPDCTFNASRIEVESQGERFVATGKVIVDPGWRQVVAPDTSESEQEDDDSQTLPRLEPNDSGVVQQATVNRKQTKPPKRYTKAGLIEAMKRVGANVQDPALRKILKDTTGIGTTATRMAIVEGLIDKGLLSLDRKQLVSTAAARSLIDALPPMVRDPATTALWEQSLDDISRGKVRLDDFMASQVAWIRKLIEFMKTNPVKLPGLEAAIHRCPKCSTGALSRRTGQYGAFWVCTAEGCDHTMDDGRGKPVPKGTGKTKKKRSGKKFVRKKK
jgi:DNA topoisomerase-3